MHREALMARSIDPTPLAAAYHIDSRQRMWDRPLISGGVLYEQDMPRFMRSSESERAYIDAVRRSRDHL